LPKIFLKHLPPPAIDSPTGRKHSADACHSSNLSKDALMLYLLHLINRFCRDEDGPAMVEYGLLVGLIALVVAAAAIFLGTSISTLFSEVGSYLAAIPVP
jgi:pilus assembly protein Flp/PilA